MSGILALLIRSLRTEARLMRSHLMRLLLLGLIYFSLALAQQTSMLFGAPGLQFFASIIWLNLVAITIAGASFFSTVITEEKEEETLGLLRMAGISPVSLLLGKMAPRLISALLLLTAQVPFTFLAITLGGVTSRQVVAAYVCLLAHLLLMATLGLLASVLSKRSRAAAWRTAIAIFLLLVLPGWLSAAFSFAAGNAPALWQQLSLNVLNGLHRASAFTQISSVTRTGFSSPLLSFQVVTNLVAAAVLFLVSWGLFEIVNRGEASTGPERRLPFGRASRLQRLGTRRAWGNPFAWKDFHFLAGGRPMLIARFVLYGVLSLGTVWLAWKTNAPARFELEQIGAGVVWVMLAAVLIELAIVASRVFHEEVKWNTLAGLRMVPRSSAYVWYSKLGGYLLGLAPAVLWLAAGAALAPNTFAETAEYFLGNSYGRLLVMQYVLFLHLTALLSLVVKWGALGLAFVIAYIANTMCLSLFFVVGGGNSDYWAVLLAVLGIIGVLALHLGVGVRLRALASR